jgi:hypothetical protein
MGAFGIEAATLYCGPASTGAATGADFNNLIALPNTTGFTRGNTYVIIEGSYGTRDFSTTTNSSADVITIRKASTADSAVAGYATTLFDGQAVFTSFWWDTGDWTIDGVTGGGPESWESGHGILLNGMWRSHINEDVNLKNLTVRHIEQNLGATVGDPNLGGGRWDYVHTVTMSYCYMHNYGADMLKINGSTRNFTLEYSKIANIFQSGDSHSDPIECVYGGMTNFVIRYNFFEDVVGTYAFGAHDDAAITNYFIYGNIFYGEATDIFFTDGLITALGCNRSVTGKLVNLYFLNNTLAGGIQNVQFTSNGCDPLGPLYAQNNIIYSDDTGAEQVGWGLATPSSNTTYNVTISGAGAQNLTGDPFTSVAGRDFSLTSDTTAGITTSFTTDMYGNSFSGAGGWSRGAVAYESPIPGTIAAGVGPGRPKPARRWMFQ